MGVYNYFMGVFMKKLFVVITAIVFLLAGCDDDPKDKEPNPYPDGVYPFEVTGVGHTQENYNNFTVTWTPPADKGFTKVQVELYGDLERGGKFYYSSVTGKATDLWDRNADNFVMGKNTFSYTTFSPEDKRVIIKSVDKFGNISEGVTYEYSWVY
jgi:hypothetical protein